MLNAQTNFPFDRIVSNYNVPNITFCPSLIFLKLKKKLILIFFSHARF